MKGCPSVEILRQCMDRGDVPIGRRELTLQVGNPERVFSGEISTLGDMVPVVAGVTRSFTMRGEDHVGLVRVGDGATSTAAARWVARY